MAARHSTRKKADSKPAKPSADFPLFPHATRRWAKKILGKMHYFGPWADPDGALASYNRQKDDLHAGRRPKESSEGNTVKLLCDRFMDSKQEAVDAGELSPRTLHDYHLTVKLIADHFGRSRLLSDLNQEDFAKLRSKMVAKGWSVVTIGNAIQRIRVVFKYGYDAELIAAPMRYGPGFKRPSKKTLRLNRAKQGKKLFSREELLRIIDVATVPLKAMVMLGLNGGFGNADCGNLPTSAVDLERGFIDFPRPKTGVERRVPLWPETIAALKQAQAERPDAKDQADAGLFFITKYGLGWSKDTSDNPVSKEFRKLLDSLDLNGHRNFYTLRHVFRTIADEARDQPSADHIMGHESTHMSSVYRETISDERLRAVVAHVRRWLLDLEAVPRAL
jgi:integrase